MVAKRTDRDVKKLYLGKECAGTVTVDGRGTSLKLNRAALSRSKESRLSEAVQYLIKTIFPIGPFGESGVSIKADVRWLMIKVTCSSYFSPDISRLIELAQRLLLEPLTDADKAEEAQRQIALAAELEHARWMKETGISLKNTKSISGV